MINKENIFETITEKENDFPKKSSIFQNNIPPHVIEK
jgi:hypothetical protein